MILANDIISYSKIILCFVTVLGFFSKNRTWSKNPDLRWFLSLIIVILSMILSNVAFLW